MECIKALPAPLPRPLGQRGNAILSLLLHEWGEMPRLQNLPKVPARGRQS